MRIVDEVSFLRELIRAKGGCLFSVIVMKLSKLSFVNLIL